MLIATLLLGLSPVANGAIADINYIFKNDVIYENNNIEFQESFNLRNRTEFTEIYYGSYSFTNDSIGSVPLGWIDSSGVDCLIQVNESLVSHSNILEVSDNSGANYANASLDFNNVVSGTIEFWVMSSDVTKLHYIRLTASGTQIIVLRLFNSDLDYHDGGAWQNIVAIVGNTWYNVRIDFETGAGAYLGLGVDKHSIWVNGVQEIATDDFNTAGTYIDGFNIISRGVDSGYNGYLDGVGLSWFPNYTIGKNLIPTIETSSLQEVNRYEFAMSGIDTFHTTGVDNPNGWTDIEVGGGDKVGIAIQGNVNGLVYSDTNVLADNRGIEKEDMSITGEFINVSFGIKPEVMDGILNRIEMTLTSFDGIAITRLRILADLSVEYQKADTSWIDIGNDITLLRNYEFNIFLDYEINRVFLIYIQDGVVENIYNYEMFFDTKSGLDDIYIISISADVNDISYFVDYVGIYNNGLSQVDVNQAFGLATRLLTDVSNWNYEHNNLFNIIAEGNFHLGTVDGVYSRASTLLVIKDTFNYISETSFFNIYDAFVSVVPIPRLVFTLVNGLFNVSYIKIDGCKLIQNSNEYFLQYSHSGIDTNESYFYVDDNNKLQFTLITNDTDTEYIQATFNISDVSSTDKAISFRGLRLNKAFGYFVVDYLSGIDTIDIPIIDKLTRAILPTNKTIDTFVILISDNDIDSIIGITTGYVSHPRLLNVLGLGLPIITAGLIEMMIPLLLILLPTLLISKGFGEEGKKLLIPLFLVFSIIATATLIIPIWIFFIIAFGIGLFLFRNKEIKDGY